MILEPKLGYWVKVIISKNRKEESCIRIETGFMQAACVFVQPKLNVGIEEHQCGLLENFKKNKVRARWRNL